MRMKLACWCLLLLVAGTDARGSFRVRAKTTGSVVVKQQTTKSFQNNKLDLRGGVLFDQGLQRAVRGALAFAGIEQIVKYGFKKYNFKYPASLGACILLFASLCVTDSVAPNVASSIYDFLVPGAAILAKWFPIFFVPGLALLPLSPRIGGTLDIAKLLLTVVLGFVYSIGTTLLGVTVIRSLQGKEPMKAQPKTVTKSTKSHNSPFSDEQWKFCWMSSVIMGVVSVVATKMDVLASPMQMVFTLLLTVASYIGASRLPPSFTKIVHPILTSSIVVLAFMRGLAAVLEKDFLTVLRTYKTGTLDFIGAGAGDYLLYFLGPSVVSFAISVYSRKAQLFQNLPMVITAMIISSAGGLYATGAFVRMIQLGGKSGNAALVRLSILARNVTTALAMAMTDMVGGDVSIAAAVVCLTGILGASYGKPLLDAMGVRDPIFRGLGIGSSSAGLGVASMSDEPDAFPFAAIAMVLTAVAATTLAAIPTVRETLIDITTGGIVTASAKASAMS